MCSMLLAAGVLHLNRLSCVMLCNRGGAPVLADTHGRCCPGVRRGRWRCWRGRPPAGAGQRLVNEGGS